MRGLWGLVLVFCAACTADILPARVPTDSGILLLDGDVADAADPEDAAQDAASDAAPDAANDAGFADANEDAMVPDVPPADTGPIDTGPVDQGPADTGPTDTGTVTDPRDASGMDG